MHVEPICERCKQWASLLVFIQPGLIATAREAAAPKPVEWVCVLSNAYVLYVLKTALVFADYLEQLRKFPGRQPAVHLVAK
jgi:hypothetical protein